MQPVAIHSVVPKNNTSQGASTNRAAEHVQSLENPSSVPHPNTNAPIFDFGSSEWSDFIQANEALESSAPLPQAEGMDPYIGFDIPFWFGQDQYWNLLHDRN